MGYPLLTTEGAKPTMGAAGSGFYKTLFDGITIRSATLNVTGDNQDTTAIDADFMTGIPGLGSWSVSIDAQAFVPPRGGNVGLLSFSAGGYTTHANKWTFRIENSPIEYTPLGAPPVWKYMRPSIPKVSGSLSAKVDSSTALVLPDVTTSTSTAVSLPTLTLTYGLDTSNNRISGAAQLVSLGVGQPLGGIQTAEYAFTGTGQWTPAGTNSPIGTSALGIPSWDQNGTTTNYLFKAWLASGGQNMSGSAFYKSIEISCEVGAPVAIKLELQGTGPLTTAAS